MAMMVMSDTIQTKTTSDLIFKSIHVEIPVAIFNRYRHTHISRVYYVNNESSHIMNNIFTSGGGGGALSIYTGGGVPRHIQKGGGVFGTGTTQKGGS